MVFDEAHEIEDVAGQYFGVSVSNYQFQDLRRDIAAVSRAKQFGSAELDRILDRLDEFWPSSSSRCSARRKAASAFKGHDAFLEEQRGSSTRMCWRALDLLGHASEADQRRAGGNHSAVPPHAGACAGAGSSGCEGDDERYRLLDRAARARLFPAGHADRCVAICCENSCSTSWIRWS